MAEKLCKLRKYGGGSQTLTLVEKGTATNKTFNNLKIGKTYLLNVVFYSDSDYITPLSNYEFQNNTSGTFGGRTVLSRTTQFKATSTSITQATTGGTTFSYLMAVFE